MKAHHYPDNFTLVNLEGGVGNQLFQYAAGLYVSKKINSNLVLNISRITGNRHSGYCITDFELPGVTYIDSTSNEPRFDNRALRLIRYFQNTGNPRLKILFEDGLGFKSKLKSIKKNRGISGYFQTCEYLNDLEEGSLSLRNLRLIQPSSLYSSLLDRSRNIQPIMMHVRRGDYLAHRESIGILSMNYYKEALSSLSYKYHNREIWVFSDEFTRVKSEFREFTTFSQLRFMEETSMMSSVEILRLMSSGSAILTANSTLSWWAGYLSRPETEVVVPNPWFRQPTTKNDLLVPTWNFCQSDWIKSD